MSLEENTNNQPLVETGRQIDELKKIMEGISDPLKTACTELHGVAFKLSTAGLNWDQISGASPLPQEKIEELKKVKTSIDLVLDFLKADKENNQPEKEKLIVSIHSQAQSLKKGPLKKLAGALLTFVGVVLTAGFFTAPLGIVAYYKGKEVFADSELANTVAKVNKAVKAGLFPPVAANDSKFSSASPPIPHTKTGPGKAKG